MWLLTSENEGKCYYVLKEKEKHTISRQTGDIVILNDQSISRIHSFLYPMNDGLYVMDAGSKYGTYINENIEIQKNPIKANTKVQLNDGDRVMFGRLGSKWKVKKYNYRCFTSTLVIKDDLQAILNRMEVEMVPTWDSDCTHLIMPQITVTHKLLLCLVSGMHVVTPDYFYTCQRCIETREPLPDCLNFIPVPSIEEKSIVTWKNISLMPDLQRSKLFCGKLFVFTKKKICDVYESLITKAGGQCRSVERQKLAKRELIVPNTIVIESSSGDTQQTQQSQVINVIKSFLIENNRRLIPDAEIGLAILYISTEKYCNPEYHFKFSIESTQHNVMPKPEFAKATEHFETLRNTNFQNTPVHVPDSAALQTPFKMPTRMDKKAKETPVVIPETVYDSTHSLTDVPQNSKRKADSVAHEFASKAKRRAATPVLVITEKVLAKEKNNPVPQNPDKDTLEQLQEGRQKSKKQSVSEDLVNNDDKLMMSGQKSIKKSLRDDKPEGSSNQNVDLTKGDTNFTQPGPSNRVGTRNKQKSTNESDTPEKEEIDVQNNSIISSGSKTDSNPFMGFDNDSQIKSPLAKSTQIEIANANKNTLDNSNKKRKRTSDGNTNAAKKSIFNQEISSQSTDVSIVNSQIKPNNFDQSMFLCSRRHEQPEKLIDKPTTNQQTTNSAPKRTVMMIDDDDEDEDNLFNFKNKKVRQNVERPQPRVFTPSSTFSSTQTQQQNKINDTKKAITEFDDDDDDNLFSFTSMRRPTQTKEISKNRLRNERTTTSTTSSTSYNTTSGLHIPDLIRPVRSDTSIENWLSSTLSNIDLKEEIKDEECNDDMSSKNEPFKSELDDENRAWLSDIKSLFQVSVVHLNLQSKSNISGVSNDTTDNANSTAARNFKAFVKKRNYVPQKSILPLKNVLVDTGSIDLDF